MQKLDYLGECNHLKVPIQDFQAAFCARCLQKECGRSQAGKSRFEQRTERWFETLFQKPARMDSSDPRFSQIQAKRFLDVVQDAPYEIGRGPAASAWLDPRDLAEAQRPVAAPLVEEEKAPDTDPSPPPPPDPKEEMPVKAAPPEPISPPAPRPRNTNFQGGQMLSGKEPPTKQPTPVYDPWAPTTKPSQPDDVKIVKPGAKIKLG